MKDALEKVKKHGLWLHLWGTYEVDFFYAAVAETVNTGRYRGKAKDPKDAINMAIEQYLEDGGRLK